jgi:proline dehydrogenase
MLRTLLLRASRSRFLESQARNRSLVRRAVRRFLPGERLEEALEACRDLAGRGIPAVLTCLGEDVVSEEEADAAARGYREAVDSIRENGLDVHVSVKPTHLGLDLGFESTAERMEALLAAAEGAGIPLWLDMEDASYVDRTLDLYRRLLLRAGPRVGVCLQAYLHRTPMDLEEVLAAGGRIRLVKGAYRESADPALQDRAEVDGAFLALAERLAREPLEEPGLRHVLGTHDLGLLERLGLGPLGGAPQGSGPQGDGSGRGGPQQGGPHEGGNGSSPPDGGPLSVQMLYGIQEGAWDALVRRDIPFRVLISYGAHWYPWFMRRLAERPSNLRFVLGRHR